jgi:hypothetical protein
MSARRFLALLGALLVVLTPATAQAAPSSHSDVTSVSRLSAAHRQAHKHKKPKKHTAPAQHACTQTSSGNCVRGGEFCPQASYGMTGWEADNRHYVCKGDHTHPHWELP